MRRRLQALLNLGRAANLPTVWTNVLAAFVLSSAAALPPWSTVCLVLIGASLMYAGGCALNDVCDVAFDRRYRPERAIPSGVFTLGQARGLAIAALALGAALVTTASLHRGGWHHGWRGIACTLGLVAAIVAYDLAHKRWPGAVWLMGLCRALLWLMPASLPHQNATRLVWTWAALILFYIGGVSLTARGESRPDGKTLSGAGIILLLLPLAGWALGIGQFGDLAHPRVLLTLAFPLTFLGVILYAIHLMKSDPPRSIGPAVGWLLAAIPLVDALALSPVAPITALALALGLPVTRALQQSIAST